MSKNIDELRKELYDSMEKLDQVLQKHSIKLLNISKEQSLIKIKKKKNVVLLESENDVLNDKMISKVHKSINYLKSSIEKL